MTRVLVTGATGFIGTALVRTLAHDPAWTVRACTRTAPHPDASARTVEWCVTPELSPGADWSAVLAGVDVVVHLAARVHQMKAASTDAGAYQRVNVLGTRRLGEQAAASGVRRLVFLSSLKAHGERGAISETSPLAPVDPYGVSKRDAEAALQAIAATSGMELVVIRPPLVYGPGVGANFRALLTAIRRGVPLPLGAIANRRSLVGIENLVHLITVCLDHPAAASQAFLVSDGDDLSTPALVRRLAAAVGRRAHVWSVPVGVLRILASATGRSAAVQRLTESLYVDISKARTVLGWRPQFSLDEQLRRTVKES